MFPLELLICVFEYMTPEELYLSFVDLNARINCILQSMVNMSITISHNFSKLKRIFHGGQFIRLIIHNYLPKKLTLPFFSSQLRFLTIPHPICDQMENINPHHFPYLEYLNIQGPSPLCHFIFSNSFRHLLKVNLIYVDISLQWSQFSSIRFINLFSDHPWAFIRVIESCPNLHIFLYKGSMPSVYKLLAPHFALKELSLNINYYPSFDKDSPLEILLSLFPNLMKISLSGCPPVSGFVRHLHPLFDHGVHLNSSMTISFDYIRLKTKAIGKSKHFTWL
jgi:hypothetical protein